MVEREPRPGLLDPRNSFFGLKLPVENRPAALQDLQDRLDAVRKSERAALDEITKNPRIIGSTALNEEHIIRGEN